MSGSALTLSGTGKAFSMEGGGAKVAFIPREAVLTLSGTIGATRIASTAVKVVLASAALAFTLQKSPLRLELQAKPVQLVLGHSGLGVPTKVAQEIHTQPVFPMDGQIQFLLDFPPVASTVEVGFNTAWLHYGTDFTVDGQTVLLLPSLGFTVHSTDRIQFRYQKRDLV